MKMLADAQGDHAAFLRIDLDMHGLIVKAADNPMLSIFMESISQPSLANRRLPIQQHGIFDRSIKDQRRIMETLKRRARQQHVNL